VSAGQLCEADVFVFFAHRDAVREKLLLDGRSMRIPYAACTGHKAMSRRVARLSATAAVVVVESMPSL
jgi:hypothetical protein